VWQRDWPVIMANAIEAASRSGAKIIFLDNIYMYGPKPLLNPITEDHPTNPPAIKGKVRKQIAESLLEAHKSGKVTAVIGRAGDFYGPGATNSPLYVSVLKEMLLGRRPLWMGNNAAVHSFIHIGDAARALVELALADDTYGQVWLLPASKPTPTVQALADTMGQILERPSGLLVVPKFALNGLTFIVPLMKELKEMLYQYETDYVISSFKFMKRFPSFTVTSYQQGITEMVEWFRKDSGK
jgi:nucleoside-diphosphate-sugar epimerase